MFPRQVEKLGERPWIAMDVVVRVQVAWRAAHQPFEAAALAAYLGMGIITRAEMDVQAHTQFR